MELKVKELLAQLERIEKKNGIVVDEAEYQKFKANASAQALKACLVR